MHFVTAKGILSSKNGMNLYRGCTHGCIYCDSRSKCYHMDHLFEDIEVKENALELLEQALVHKRKKCMIGMGSMTDPYIPLETELRYTRGALELIYRYGFGATLITKSDRILDDLDILEKINGKTKAVVQMTLTTCDEELCKRIEPNVCTTKARFEALKRLRNSGIPTVVWLCPILPFINDTEENISGIVDMCAEARVYGIICFGMGLTLREGNREYFYSKLDSLFPDMKEKYIRQYGDRYIMESPNSGRLTRLFNEKCDAAGIVRDNQKIFDYLQTFEEKEPKEQLGLWN